VRIGLDRIDAWIPADEAHAASGWTSELPRQMGRDLGAALAGAEAPLVLDVRGADEYAAGHVDGALNIPYTRLSARLGEIPNHRRIFVHCASGQRAAMAASFLASKHFDVVHVDGSFDELKGSVA
jgi:hydroxyacylglutathione hydrolase